MFDIEFKGKHLITIQSGEEDPLADFSDWLTFDFNRITAVNNRSSFMVSCCLQHFVRYRSIQINETRQDTGIYWIMCVEYVQSGNQQTISPCVPEEDDKNDLMTVVLDSRIVCDCISTFYL